MSNRTPPRHFEQTYFPVENGCLMVGGRPLVDIASDLAPKPFYVYDSRVLDWRVATLRKALPKETVLHYAMKANPMPEVVAHMLGLVDGLDLASAGELKVAMAVGADPQETSFAGPAKQVWELREAMQAGIVINIESETELARIKTLAQEMGKPCRTAVRVNPDFELKASGMKMGGGAQQFGIDAERVPAVLKELASDEFDFQGFHIYSGSQNLQHEAICETQQKTVELALRLSKDAPSKPKFLNIGGGFGIPYFPGEKALDLDPIGDNLDKLIPKVRSELGDTQVVLELGRFMVGESGLYVCRIVDKKISRGSVFLITDGGLHHHLAASGNFGQIIRKNYPVLIANRCGQKETEIASVVGPLCTPLDLLANKMDLPKAEIGDWVAVLQSGAYGYTASPHGFLSHPAPQQVFV